MSAHDSNHLHHPPRAGFPRVAHRVGRAALVGLIGLALAGDLTAADGAEPWTLERALAHAKSSNPDLRIADQRLRAAQAGLEQANSAFWPRLQLQSSYSRTDNPMLVFGSVLNQRAYRTSLDFNRVPDVDNLNARGVVTLPLYAGGRNAATRRAAQAYSEAAQLDRAAVENLLGFEIARTFHTIHKARQFIRATEAAVTSLETNLGVARKRLEAGTLLKSERLDIEVRLAQAREDQLSARNASAIAERALRNLLGLDQGDFVVADQIPSVLAPKGSEAVERPELEAARQRGVAAEDQVRVAKAGYHPRLNAFGSLDYDRGWTTHGEGGSYSVGILAQWDLWDGFSTRSRVKEARANAEADREEQHKLRLAIEFEIEQARRTLTTAAARMEVTRVAIDQAAESLGLTKKRFEQGVALTSQLLDAETALLQARVRRAESEADYQIAVAALRKALALPQLDASSPAK